LKLSTEQTASIESEILKRVRACPGISRVALARDLRIAASTAGNYVGRLITEGFLAESEKAEREAGRPPTVLRLNPEGGQFIGVDFEARNIMAMAVDFSDRPLKHVRSTIDKSNTVTDILKKIERSIVDVLADNASRPLAIGIGVPGLVDAENGIALQYKHINQWKNVQLTEPLAKKFGVPVYLENCVRSMALAEMWFGQGRGERDFICLGIRTGIGAGIVAGGELQRGGASHAGEIGRWRVAWPDSPFTRFFKGKEVNGDPDAELEDVASVRAIVGALERARTAKEKTILLSQRGPLSFVDVVRAAQQRDTLTMQIIEAAAEMLGRSVSQLIFALNPSKVIIAGPLTLLGDSLLHPLRASVKKALRSYETDIPMILNSTMGEFNGALGAAALAVHQWKPSR
jgi:predicted NBD/HSP70 family sugar kinase